MKLRFVEKSVSVLVPGSHAIGDQAKQIRKRRKLTLETAASRIGISIAYLSKLERGEREWSKDLVSKFNRSIQGK